MYPLCFAFFLGFSFDENWRTIATGKKGSLLSSYSIKKGSSSSKLLLPASRIAIDHFVCVFSFLTEFQMICLNDTSHEHRVSKCCQIIFKIFRFSTTFFDLICCIYDSLDRSVAVSILARKPPCDECKSQQKKKKNFSDLHLLSLSSISCKAY